MDSPDRKPGGTVIGAHGSYLTCHHRLGCTSPRHARLRREYRRAVSEEWRRVHGMSPRGGGRTHGLRSTYRVCTAGADGGPCDKCKEAERSYKAAYRAARAS